MQLNEFLDNLTAIKDDYGWFINSMSFADMPMYLIRGRDKNNSWVCPILAVCQNLTGKLYSGLDHEKAGADIGLSRHLTKTIMRSTDTLMNWDWEIRAQIIERLGLEENAGCLGYYASSRKSLAAR